MRFVELSNAKPGMKTASEVIDSIGRVLIAGDTLLTEQYIDKLDEYGVFGVYINDAISEDIDIKPPISPALRTEGLTAVQNKDIDACLIVSKKIVEEILENGMLAMDMMDLRSFDNYTFAHSVNVAVVACNIGFGLGLSENSLEDLVFASLLHDMGKLSVPEEILSKPGRLTPEEFALIKTHPSLSYDLLAERVDVSSYVKNAVLCHHENHDGTGYPNGLSGQSISLLARILHVADVYDALTSARPYKKPYSPLAAIEIMKNGKGTTFDPVIVDSLVSFVPLYPKGTMVELSDGTTGIVIENSEEHNLRPVIRRDDYIDIDLSLDTVKHLSITNPAALDYQDVIEDEKERSKMTAPIVKRHIMFIDKFGDSYRNISKKLEYLYTFTWAQSESQAEGYILRDGMPDLIVIDIDSKEINDESKLQEAKEKVAGRVPVLVLGSFDDVETIKRFRNHEVAGYVLKPYRITYLQSQFQAYINPQT